jgi:hypothetical protein
VANRDWLWNPRTKALTLVVEFANRKDPLWNIRAEADRDLLWNSRTGNPEVGCEIQELGSPEIGDGFWELKRLQHCCGIQELAILRLVVDFRN